MGIIPCMIMSLVTLCTGKTSGEPMPCEAGHFVLGQSGYVTCHFSHNMKGSERHIYVVLYPFQEPDSFSGYNILRCSGLNLRKPICRVADGYQFNSDISERLTVTIPKVKNTSAGLYVCQLVPPDDRQSRGCNLTVEGTRATETTPLLTTRPDDDENNVSGSDSIDVTNLVIDLSLSALCVVLLAILLYMCIKRRKTSRCARKQEFNLRLDDVTCSACGVSGHKRGDPACQAVTMESIWDRPPGQGAVDPPPPLAPLDDDDHDDDNDDNVHGSDAESEKFEDSVPILPPPVASSTPGLSLSTPVPAASSNAKKNSKVKGNKDKDRQARDKQATIDFQPRQRSSTPKRVREGGDSPQSSDTAGKQGRYDNK